MPNTSKNTAKSERLLTIPGHIDIEAGFGWGIFVRPEATGEALRACWRRLVYAGGVHQNEQEDAMNMRGPGGIIGVIVVIVVIFLLLRLLGLI